MQHFWSIMLYDFTKYKNAAEKQKQICTVCGEGAVTDQMCQKWFVMFYAEDFLLDDALRLGRPVEVDSDQIETLIENDQHSTMWESLHTQNIQINKVIGENEKCVLHVMEKMKRAFWTAHQLCGKGSS